tara:strand:+ start:675 stop:1586 length:912 start_codon:yes stop_codon:yes gene_type:complete
MLKILFIGSSKIIEEHIKAALQVKFKLYSLNSTRKHSRNEKKIHKKYRFEKKFRSWKEAVDYSANKKNVVFLIASRIQDTEKILKYCGQCNNKIFVEKPITNKNNEIIVKNNKNIFVGYNRIYFNLLSKISKYNIKKFYCNVNISYKNFSEVRKNISHIISILLFLFGDLKLFYKIKNDINKTYILKDRKKNHIILNLINTRSDNYSLNIISKNISFLLKPIEILSIYKSTEFIFFSKNKKKLFVNQKLHSKFNEFKFNNFKPGFLSQMKYFKKFCIYKNYPIINNLRFANKVIRLSEKITNI